MKTKGHDIIRILLADDHPVVRDGIRLSLSKDKRFRVVGEAVDGVEVMKKCVELLPDVVLMDISMPQMNGLEATKHLQRKVPRTKVLILTAHDYREYVVNIISSGARGYLLKDASPSELIHAIKTVHSGQTFFNKGISEIFLDEFVKGEGKIELSQLSRREREVLSLIAGGYSNREIAERLFVSVRTIETHRERIMKKLDIHSAAGLTKYAIAHGLAQMDLR